MSDSVRPHRRQPSRLPRPWDSPGKNTGVGCHFLLQCRKVKSESEVSQLCPTLCNPMDCSLQGSSVHGILQARVLEWGAIAFSNSFWLDILKHWKVMVDSHFCFNSLWERKHWFRVLRNVSSGTQHHFRSGMNTSYSVMLQVAESWVLYT